jgi:hypothetical protein
VAIVRDSTFASCGVANATGSLRRGQLQRPPTLSSRANFFHRVATNDDSSRSPSQIHGSAATS